MATNSLTPRPARRTYNQQFKAEMVAQCLEGNVALASLAIDHGMNPNVLHRWVTEHERYGKHTLQDDGVALPVQTVDMTPANWFALKPLPVADGRQVMAPTPPIAQAPERVPTNKTIEVALAARGLTMMVRWHVLVHNKAPKKNGMALPTGVRQRIKDMARSGLRANPSQINKALPEEGISVSDNTVRNNLEAAVVYGHRTVVGSDGKPVKKKMILHKGGPSFVQSKFQTENPPLSERSNFGLSGITNHKNENILHRFSSILSMDRTISSHNNGCFSVFCSVSSRFRKIRRLTG